MLGQPVHVRPARVTQNTPQPIKKSESTCVGRFNNISDVVAAEISACTFIPSKAVDIVYAVKSLYDIKIAKPKTPVQHQVSVNGSQTPLPNQATANSLQSPKDTQQTPSPNPTVIPDAKVQWKRDIHDDDVRATMKSYDQFFAKHVTHNPKDIPNEAYVQLAKGVRNGKVAIDVITPEHLETIKPQKNVWGRWGKVIPRYWQ